MDQAEVGAVVDVGGKIVEVFGHVHHCRDAPRIHLLQNMVRAGEEAGIGPNTFILTAFAHVSDDAPLTRLAFLLHHKERGVSKDGHAFFNIANHAQVEKFVDKGRGGSQTSGIHGCVGGEPFRRWDEEILLAALAELIPVFRREFPPQELEPFRARATGVVIQSVTVQNGNTGVIRSGRVR